MHHRFALAQTCHPADGDVVSLVKRAVCEAHDSAAEIVVFPESLMSRFEAEKGAFLKEAQPIEGPFSQAIDAIAAEYGIWVVYTMNEKNEGGNPFNTAIITDSSGVKRGVYRKVHLFDSSAVKESERMSSSDEIFTPIQTPLGCIGLGICYDIRFPEYARRQALGGCDILIYPAAWVDGPFKALQWKTLLQARAIENEIFTVGVCRADEGYVGQSYIFAPNGDTVAETSAGRCIAVGEIDLDAIAEMRTAIPSLEHRRPELY